MFPHTNAYSSAFRQCSTKPLAPWQHPEFLYPHNKDYVVLKNRANNSIQNICHTLKYSKSSNIWYAREIFLFCFHASLSNPSEQITTGYMEYKFKWAKLYAQSLERAHLQDRRPLCPGDSLSLQTSIPSASCLFHLLMLRLLTSWTDIAGRCLYLLQINCSLKTISAPILVTVWIPLMRSWFLPGFRRFPAGEKRLLHSWSLRVKSSQLPLSERTLCDIRNT